MTFLHDFSVLFGVLISFAFSFKTNSHVTQEASNSRTVSLSVVLEFPNARTTFLHVGVIPTIKLFHWYFVTVILVLLLI